MVTHELLEFLEEKYNQYNNPAFIATDPIQIPHLFATRNDIEIAAFLTATISWGNRCSIINNASRLMKLMDNSPYEYLMNLSVSEKPTLEGFCHRTFNSIDAEYFLLSLKNIYQNHGGLKDIFETFYKQNHSIEGAIMGFRNIFFELPHESRTEKHVSDVSKGSSAKRINMFLRWMIRNDRRHVDFGLWKDIPSSALYLPLDVHTGNVARKLGILSRKQNDWKAVEEVTRVLREFDPTDPVKYDFALFGLGIFENF
jgi:uncharacterized protein (TIGR02757 family)